MHFKGLLLGGAAAEGRGGELLARLIIILPINNNDTNNDIKHHDNNDSSINTHANTNTSPALAFAALPMVACKSPETALSLAFCLA